MRRRNRDLGVFLLLLLATQTYQLTNKNTKPENSTKPATTTNPTTKNSTDQNKTDVPTKPDNEKQTETLTDNVFKQNIDKENKNQTKNGLNGQTNRPTETNKNKNIKNDTHEKDFFELLFDQKIKTDKDRHTDLNGQVNGQHGDNDKFDNKNIDQQTDDNRQYIKDNEQNNQNNTLNGQTDKLTDRQTQTDVKKIKYEQDKEKYNIHNIPIKVDISIGRENDTKFGNITAENFMDQTTNKEIYNLQHNYTKFDMVSQKNLSNPIKMFELIKDKIEKDLPTYDKETEINKDFIYKDQEMDSSKNINKTIDIFSENINNTKLLNGLSKNSSKPLQISVNSTEKNTSIYINAKPIDIINDLNKESPKNVSYNNTNSSSLEKINSTNIIKLISSLQPITNKISNATNIFSELFNKDSLNNDFDNSTSKSNLEKEASTSFYKLTTNPKPLTNEDTNAANIFASLFNKNSLINGSTDNLQKESFSNIFNITTNLNPLSNQSINENNTFSFFFNQDSSKNGSTNNSNNSKDEKEVSTSNSLKPLTNKNINATATLSFLFDKNSSITSSINNTSSSNFQKEASANNVKLKPDKVSLTNANIDATFSTLFNKDSSTNLSINISNSSNLEIKVSSSIVKLIPNSNLVTENINKFSALLNKDPPKNVSTNISSSPFMEMQASSSIVKLTSILKPHKKSNATNALSFLFGSQMEQTEIPAIEEEDFERTMPLFQNDGARGNGETIEHRVNLGSEFDLESEDDSFYSPERREVEDAVDFGLRKMHELVLVKEPELYRKGLWLKRDNPAMHVAAFSAPSEQARKLARYGYASLQAATKLQKQHGSLGRNNPELRDSFRDTALHSECPLRGSPRCRPAARRYRTADGTCNNLGLPWRGAALTPQQRFLPPRYEDGLQSVRRSVLGTQLPSARELSTVVHSDRDVETSSVTLMLMQWGQLLDHDITSSAQSRGFNSSVPQCCADGGRDFQPPQFMHPDCLPIPVPPNDWFLSRFGIRCVEFIRSAPTSRIDCDLGWREQINQVTSYIDASPIYGISAPQADSQRVFRGGRLQNHRLDTRNPPDPPGGDICHMGAITADCFRPGDGRVREQPALTSFHIVWTRKHNQLAELMERANPHWSDEKLYQETRRVVGALMQHISYREFLPIVLGQEVLRLFDLELVQKGYYTGYDPVVNPSAANSFTTAAFRFGHSLVQKSFVRSDVFHRPLFNNVTLHEEQTNPENIWSRGSVDRLLLGMCNQPSQRRDEFITVELTNHLFQTPGSPFGIDLAAINIQRGRDHGIPPYTAWRKPCGLSPIDNWLDVERVMSIETASKFRSIYASVDDIDLYSAGLAEKPVRGGLVGPTFACIIAQQFSNLRKGDRFWYENGNFESSFTPAQLQQIRKVTFGEIICNTMKEVETIQPFVFMAPDEFANRRESCQSLMRFDIGPWAERVSNLVRGRPGFGRKLKEGDLEDKDTKLSGSDIEEKLINIAKELNLVKENINPNEEMNKLMFGLDKSIEQTPKTVNRLTKRNIQIPFIEILSNFPEKPEDLSRINNDGDLPDRIGKRKRPNTRRKTKPKNSTLVVNHNRNKVKVKRPHSSTFAPNEKTYYDQNQYTIHNIPEAPTYRPTHRPIVISTQRPTSNDEISIIVPAQRPEDLTYLINTVTKKPTLKTSTNPDYNIHIQINYYLNSTDKNKLKPQGDFFDQIAYQSDNPNNPYSPNVDFVDVGYGQTSTTQRPHYSTTTKRPYYSTTKRPYYSTTNRPYSTKKPTTKRPYYSSTTTYYSTTKRPTYSSTTTYYSTTKRHYKRRTTTERPYYHSTTQRPYEISQSHPLSVYYATQRPTTKRPNVIIIEDPNDNYNRPQYGQYNQINDYYRPNYDYQSPYEPKRPVVGHIVKLENKPIAPNIPLPYQEDEHSAELPHKIYYLNNHYQPNGHNNYGQNHYDNLDDKLDFAPFLTKYPDKNYVQVQTTHQRPYEQDHGTNFVKISSVRGHTTSTKHFEPVFVSVQQKSADDDLELNYSDVYEFFAKPDNDTDKNEPTPSETRNDEWQIFNTTSEEEHVTMPHMQSEDETSIGEFPKPMELKFDDDDSFDFMI